MSGIDWEDILGAEGADMQDAYEEMVADAMVEMMDRWDREREEECLELDFDETDAEETDRAAEADLEVFSVQLQKLLKLGGEFLFQAGAFREALDRLPLCFEEEDLEDEADDIGARILACRNTFFDQLLELFPELKDYLEQSGEEKRAGVEEVLDCEDSDMLPFG